MLRCACPPICYLLCFSCKVLIFKEYFIFSPMYSFLKSEISCWHMCDFVCLKQPDSRVLEKGTGWNIWFLCLLDMGLPASPLCQKPLLAPTWALELTAKVSRANAFSWWHWRWAGKRWCGRMDPPGCLKCSKSDSTARMVSQLPVTATSRLRAYPALLWLFLICPSWAEFWVLVYSDKANFFAFHLLGVRQISGVLVDF